jgi:GT2 family glycosyltransferase
MNLQVDVVVVSYNTKDLLLDCLASVFESAQSRNVRAVVVDNASQDGSMEAVRRIYPQANAINNTTNVGFAAACNQAIRITDSPFILLLNSDARLTSQAFDALCDCLENNARCGAAGCRLIDTQGAEETSARNFLTPLNQALELAGITVGSALRRTTRPNVDGAGPDCSVDWIVGACLMLRRAAIEEVGLFDEGFFMYSEDEDLCFRLRKMGWQVCYCGDVTAIHHRGASSRLIKDEALRQFYKSQIRFLSKHRGRLSATLFMAMMRIVLFLRQSLLSGSRREDARAHLEALRGARRDHSRRQVPSRKTEARQRDATPPR